MSATTHGMHSETARIGAFSRAWAAERRLGLTMLSIALIAFGVSVVVAWATDAGTTGVVAAGVISLAVGTTAVILMGLARVDELSAAQQVSVFRAAFDASDDPKFAVDAAGGLTLGNDSFYRRLSAGGAETLDKLAAAFDDAEEAGVRLRDLHRAALSQEAGAIDLVRTAADGRQVVWRVAARPAGSGMTWWSAQDMTEIVAAAREHQHLEAACHDVFDAAPLGLYRTDGHGTVVAINSALATMLDIEDAEALLGVATPSSLFDLDDEDAATLDGGTSVSRTVALPDNPAGKGPDRADLCQMPLPGDGQAALGLVQPRVGTESDLAVGQPDGSVYRDAFDLLPIGMALLDGDGRIARANKALVELCNPGRPRDDSRLVGDEFTALVAEADRPAAVAYIAQARAAGADAASEAAEPLTVTLAGSRPVVVAIGTRTIELPDGGATGLMLTVQDITSQRQLEQQFTQAQKMQAVGQLAGGVAHDFNNLLTAMIGYCDLLLARTQSSDQSFADIMQIKQNANRAANLVRQLLAFSRKQTLQPRVLNLTDVLGEIGHLLRRLLGDGIELKLVYSRELWLVKADLGQLEQVIINLAVNARDAMDGHGTLTIETANFPVTTQDDSVHEAMPPGDYIRLSVADSGVGIDKEIINRIWEPFFTTKDVGAGTGLGLSTCYGIVKQTGGFIFADSAVGEGTTFSIYLPRHEVPVEEKAKPSQAAVEARDLTGAGTILLVEDEDAVRLFSTRALRNKGYDVRPANSGEQALAMFDESEEQIDLVVTDVMMPEMDGPTLIKHLRERVPDIKVICMSGYAEDALRERLADDTGIHFLAKPFNLNDLAGLVKEVLSA